ncbi:hypothetical protein C2E23DRAFT_270914 [Lenzites betulinus]|nr:hypothetical protein C2E23DRAFT_270914 [Lenzites betulinus]
MLARLVKHVRKKTLKRAGRRARHPSDAQPKVDEDRARRPSDAHPKVDEDQARRVPDAHPEVDEDLVEEQSLVPDDTEPILEPSILEALMREAFIQEASIPGASVSEASIPGASVSEASIHIGPLYGLPPPALECSTLNEAFSDWDSFRWARIGVSLIDRPAFSALWNARLPVNQLPVEILVAIFQLVPDPPFFRSDRVNGPEWVLLGRVCRHWRAVLLEHACFWRTICVQKRPHWFQLAVARSQQALLELDVVDLSVVASVDVSTYRDRIWSLNVWFRPHLETDVFALSSIISGPSPSLRRLEITNLWDRSPRAAGTPGVIILNVDDYPLMTHFTVSDVDVPWSARFVSQLTTLDLRRCSIYPSRISFDVFIDVLEHGRQLEDLTLDRFLAAACHTGSHPPRPRNQIALPRLRSLTITDESRLIRWLTASIQLPKDTTLNGFLTDAELQDRTHSVVDHAALLYQANDHQSVFRQSNEAVICLLPRKYTLKSHHSSVQRDLAIAFDGPSKPHINLVFEQVISLFDATNLTSLDLVVPTSQLAQDASTLLRLLDTFKNLTSLSFEYAEDGDTLSEPIPQALLLSLCSMTGTSLDPTPGDLMDHISHGVTPSGHQSCVRCPKLQRLTLHKFDWEDGALMEGVLSCLRMRGSHGAPPLRGLSVATIRQPRSKDWRTMDEQFANAAKDLLAGPSAEYDFTALEVIGIPGLRWTRRVE